MRNDFFDQHSPSRQAIEQFPNKHFLPNNSTLLVDLKRSHGPLLHLIDGSELFDARSDAPPIGYNASPLFGSLHFFDNWRGVSKPCSVEASALQNSFYELNERIGRSPRPTLQSTASMHREYISLWVRQQYGEQTRVLAESIASQVPKLLTLDSVADANFENQTFRLRPSGPKQDHLLETRIEYGLLFDVLGDEFKFTLSHGFRAQHLESFWQHLQSWLAGTSKPTSTIQNSSKISLNYQFHQGLLEQKLKVPKQLEPGMDPREYLQDELTSKLPETNFEIALLTADNYPAYRQQILDMQARIYEPARQTSAEEFDTLFDTARLKYQQGDKWIERPPLSILLLVDKEIVSMAFAGPLDLFPETRGAKTDPHSTKPNTYYMLDLTVIPEYRGQLGRLMKNALTLLASQLSIRAIHGRNRDQLARGMWAINLSLGSYELQHLSDDYDDEHEHRDCIYYRCPLYWSRRVDEPNWSQGFKSPLDSFEFGNDFLFQHMPSMVNGQKETTTATFEFVQELNFLLGYWPKELRQVFLTCTPREACERTLQLFSRSNEGGEKQFAIAMEGAELGNTDQAEVVRIANPLHVGKAQYYEQLKAALSQAPKDGTTTVLVEPILPTTCDRLSRELLGQTKKLCRDAKAILIMLESDSLAFRYHQEFAASSIEELAPDAVIAKLGDSMSLVLGRKQFQPRDFFHGGEPFCLFSFNEFIRHIGRDFSRFQNTLADFDEYFSKLAGKKTRFRIQRGVGWIEGDLPTQLAARLEQNHEGRYLVKPSLSQMRKAIAAPSI